jgi:hypothetical protein
VAAWLWGPHSVKLGFVDRGFVASFPVRSIRLHLYRPLTVSDLSFDPIFVLPLSNDLVQQRDTPLGARSTGRRTGTGSAAISLPTKPVARRANIVGFRKVSLLHIIIRTGSTPLDASNGNCSSLEEIRSSANRPVVVFPECTTCNGRGLLKFADIFKDRPVPVKGYKVFVMCVRCVKRMWFLPNLTVRPFSGMIHPQPCVRRCHIPFRHC